MEKLQIGTSNISASGIGLGCMRLSTLSKKEAARVIQNAVEAGVDFFDHADIYGKGKAEETFAEAIKLTSIQREDILLQTKCGIRKGYFDFSKKHIIESVDGSLQRLQTDYIDILLLHRPDALMEPEEVAEAFSILEKSGKVRQFGVSNQNPMQIELLNQYIEQNLIINQLQFSLMHTVMLDAELNVNMQNSAGIVRDSSVMDYCRLHNMTVQAWSPFQYGMIKGSFVGNDQFPEVNTKLQELAEQYNITASAVAIAWILRHPAKIQPIVGSMNPERLLDIVKASEVKLTRKEWYELYRAAGNELP
ncbi:aldo/keto reductase family oxidoreductase [Thalassorhabdus alkalitolerans]|uniref:Aldo/keto reductase family oxidoreductase n=1 Tax=Thalassorhabdus alkalitolerans TaxID=2282697 RepID=A0ABW0YTA9_9BACI